MPAKTKVTKQMIIDAAFEIAREFGAENINARSVAKKLQCSTQPIMYHFSTIEELKKVTYEKADKYHSDFLMQGQPSEDTFLEIGWNYIRFAIEEPQLFRFLFQSNYFSGATIVELIDADELLPVLYAMQNKVGGSLNQIKNVFVTVFLFTHGYASFIANNAVVCDEKKIKSQLESAFRGAMLAEKENSELEKE